jgi:hypothetical protein
MAMLSSDSHPPAARNLASPAGRGAGMPSLLLISIGGVMALLAIAAAWLWVTRGASILLDIGQLFCL